VKAPLGVNTIGNKMKVIAERAGYSHKYTNHSLRATTCTLLDETGFQNRHIMSVTGHRSEASLKHYSRTSDERKQVMRTILAQQMQETEEVTPEANSVEIYSESPEEQLILNENINIGLQQNGSRMIQNFHFHGSVTFVNK